MESRLKPLIIAIIITITSIICIYTLLISSSPMIIQDQTNYPIGEIYGSKIISQSFVSSENGLNRIDILLATYARNNTENVSFYLREADSNTDIVIITVNAEKIRDNTYHSFKFGPILESKGKTYIFSIESPDSKPGDAITIWHNTEDTYPNGSILMDNISIPGDLGFRVYYFEIIFGVLQILLLVGLVSGFIWIQAWGITADYMNDTHSERKQDAEREEYFSRQYPHVNSTPLIGTICKWLYAQTWIYCGLLLTITLIGLWLRLKGLGTMEYRGDEFEVIDTAYGYLKSGTLKQWDWLADGISDEYYTRAWPHTLMIALSFRLFGFSEWSARLPSLFFGTILIPLSYFIGKHATERKVIGFLLAVIVAFSPMMIYLSRYARMYVIFIPLFVIGSYLLFCGLKGKSTWNLDGFPILKCIVRIFDFDFRYIILACIVLLCCYIIHINTVIICLGMLVFTIIMSIASKETRYIYLAGFFLLVFTILMIGYFTKTSVIMGFFDLLGYSEPISLFAPQKLEYINWLFQYPFGICISAVLLAGILVLISRELLFYLCLTTTALVFFVFFSNRYFSYMYISNYYVFAWLLVLPGAALLSYFLFGKKKNTWQIGFSLIVLLAVLFSIMASNGGIFQIDYDEKSYGHFREGYAELNEGYRTGDLLMGQYLRTVYITIDGEVTHESLKSYQEYSYEKFLETIAKYDRIWITWETRKSYHIKPEIIHFVDSNFVKIHGEGIDDTNVELYVWDKTHDGFDL